jgi:ABC-type lipoprotein export system ATPase subunit
MRVWQNMVKNKVILEARGLKKYYLRGEEIVKALDGVDFEIRAGEIISIVGPSGSGKTTLMNLISCLDKATSGTLKIGDIDVTNVGEKELIQIRRQNIGFIFQQFYLIPTLTARENVELPLIFCKKKVDEAKVSDLLETVGLKGKGRIQAKHLSGGDKQRIGIARALVNDPKLLIADEPTGKLETKVRNELLKLFVELSKSEIAIFIATHDLELAQATQKIIHLQDGKVVPKEESTLYY